VEERIQVNIYLFIYLTNQTKDPQISDVSQVTTPTKTHTSMHKYILKYTNQTNNENNLYIIIGL